MDKISRRNFTGQMVHSMLTLALVESLSGANLLGKAIDREARNWLAEVEEISLAVKNKRAGQVEWRRRLHAEKRRATEISARDGNNRGAHKRREYSRYNRLTSPRPNAHSLNRKVN